MSDQPQPAGDDGAVRRAMVRADRIRRVVPGDRYYLEDDVLALADEVTRLRDLLDSRKEPYV